MVVAEILKVLHRVLSVGVDNMRVSDSLDFVRRMKIGRVGHVKQTTQDGGASFQELQNVVQKFSAVRHHSVVIRLNIVVVRVIIGIARRRLQVREKAENAIEAGVGEHQRVVSLQENPKNVDDDARDVQLFGRQRAEERSPAGSDFGAMRLDNHHATSDDLILNVAVALLHVEDVLERLQERFIEVEVRKFRLLHQESRDNVVNVFNSTLRNLAILVTSRLLKISV